MFAEIQRQKSLMSPAAFDVYTLDIMHRLATGQAPVSAVSGAVAATPVEQSAIEDQVLHTSLLFTCYIKLYHVV